VIVVLTGLRLLTVDTASWRMGLNLQLRKVAAVDAEAGSTAVLLHLFARRRQATDPRPASSSEARGITPAATAIAAPTAEAIPAAATPAGAPTSAAAGQTAAGETRRLVCHTEEAAAAMLAQLREALSLRSRKRIWHDTIDEGNVSATNLPSPSRSLPLRNSR